MGVPTRITTTTLPVTGRHAQPSRPSRRLTRRSPNQRLTHRPQRERALTLVPPPPTNLPVHSRATYCLDGKNTPIMMERTARFCFLREVPTPSTRTVEQR